MPYITPEDRDQFEELIDGLVKDARDQHVERRGDRLGQLFASMLTNRAYKDIGRGEFNYIFSEAVLRAFEDVLPKYDWFNDAIGAFDAAKLLLNGWQPAKNCGILSCAQAELLRRLVAPYEDSKAHTNGDLPAYPTLLRRMS